MQLSVLCNRRMAASESLEAFFAAYAVRLGRKLVDVLRDVLQPGETMPDFALVFRLLGRHLKRLRERLDAADERNGHALASATTARRRRDETVRRLRRLYLSLRQLVAGGHGEDALALTGLALRLPRRPFVLWEQCRQLVSRVARPSFELSGSGIRPGQIAERLAPDVRRLGKDLDACVAAVRRVEWARYRRDEAKKELETGYAWLGQLARAFCHVLGEDRLGERTHRPLRSLDRKRQRPAAKPAMARAEEAVPVPADVPVPAAVPVPASDVGQACARGAQPAVPRRIVRAKRRALASQAGRSRRPRRTSRTVPKPREKAPFLARIRLAGGALRQRLLPRFQKPVRTSRTGRPGTPSA